MTTPTTASTALFPITTTGRIEKGRRSMRALQDQIVAVWHATTETDTSLCRHHGLEPDVEPIAIATATALVTIRTIDLEVFQGEHGTSYSNAKKADRIGRVVDGLVLIRNTEVHLPVVLDPHAARVLSLMHPEQGMLYRVLPGWPPYEELPVEIQTNTKTNERCHNAYRSDLQGAWVVETLLDAFAWFLRCDAGLARVDADGELAGFPLPDLWQHDYERRHPDWPNKADYDGALRDDAQLRPPGGRARCIRHRLLDEDGQVEAYCGYTQLDHGGHMFTESPEQVSKDITGGYPYCLQEAGESVDEALTSRSIELGAGGLVLHGEALSNIDLTPYDTDLTEPRTWRSWWDLATDDPMQYVRQRIAH